MIKQIVMSEEEYQKLLEIKNKPDILLRETNKKLVDKVEQLEKQIKQSQYENIKVDAPYIIEDGILKPGSHHNFVLLYNKISKTQDVYKASLKISDKVVFKELNEWANTYYCESIFKSILDVKKYRQNLVNTGLYRINKNTHILEKV